MNVSNQPAASAKPVETILKVKAKKRKSVVDFNILAQRDIEGLMQKKQATQVPTRSMFQLHIIFSKETEQLIIGTTTSVVVKTMSPPATIPPESSPSLPSSESLKISPEPFRAVAGQTTPPPPSNISGIVSQVCLSTSISIDAE